MVHSIPISEKGDREVILIPKPTFVTDKDDELITIDGRPEFRVKSVPSDYEFAKPCPIKQIFFDRFAIRKKGSLTPTQLAVFLYLAGATTWSEARVLFDPLTLRPCLTPDGDGQAVLSRYGNRTSTRSILQIADYVEASYGAVQKALKQLMHLELIWPIKTHERQEKIEEATKSGRPVEFVRYEMDPQYVWNGHIYLGTGYNLCFMYKGGFESY